MSVTKLNMINWIFYFQLVIQCFVASILTLNGWTEHYVLMTASKDAILYGSLATQYTMIALPFGMWLGLIFFGYSKNTILFESFLEKRVVGLFDSEDRAAKVVLYSFSLMSVFSVVYVLTKIGSIPLFSVFNNLDATEIAAMRQGASRGFSGNGLIKNVLALMLAPLLAYISYCYWIIDRSRVNSVWFFTMLISSIFILTYDFSKSPLVFFSIGFIFLNVFIKGGVKKKIIIFFSACTISFLVFIYTFLMNVDELTSFNSGILGRIFLGQASGIYMAFNYFPSTFEHIGFSSISQFLSSVFNIEYSERAARLVMFGFNPSGVENGTAGVMNSLFIAEAWANWGWFGVVFSPVYVGLVIQGLYMFFLRSPKNPLLLGAYAFLATKIPITGGVNDFIYNPIFALVFSILLLVYFCTLVLKRV